MVTWTSAPLTSTLAVTGRLSAVLNVATNCSDTDFTVKLTDVFPNGSSLLVQDGIVRMRWRDGGAQPSLPTPNQVTGLC